MHTVRDSRTPRKRRSIFNESEIFNKSMNKLFRQKKNRPTFSEYFILYITLYQQQKNIENICALQMNWRAYFLNIDNKQNVLLAKNLLFEQYSDIYACQIDVWKLRFLSR